MKKFTILFVVIAAFTLADEVRGQNAAVKSISWVTDLGGETYWQVSYERAPKVEESDPGLFLAHKIAQFSGYDLTAEFAKNKSGREWMVILPFKSRDKEAPARVSKVERIPTKDGRVLYTVHFLDRCPAPRHPELAEIMRRTEALANPRAKVTASVSGHARNLSDVTIAVMISDQDK